MWRRITPKLVKKVALVSSLLTIVFLITGCEQHFVGMLNPKGLIAYEERKLLFDTLALMLIVVLPVIVMSFVFIYHYQISHRVTDYKPNWAHSYLLEILWWGIPCAIILILAIITWKKTHELDPYNPIVTKNGKSPLLIHVIALPWKWLFIYPSYGIATVNYLEIPVNRVVEYWMTTDNVPMSAFFIPQLGSQIYVMAGMRTRLHLVANQIGIFTGMNTQFNGDGFSDMRFPVHVVEEHTMQQWVNSVRQLDKVLNPATYNMLLQPSINMRPQFYVNRLPNLLHNVLSLYMNSLGLMHPRQDQAKFSSISH